VLEEHSLIDVAAAVADGAGVDWQSAAETASTAEERQLLDALKLIADIQPPPVDVTSPDRLLPATPDTPAHELGVSSGVGEAEQPFDEWGPLKLIAKVGRGTFGDVYRAWDTRLDREVALKILRRHESIDEASKSTVIEEGRLLARVRHHNVVTVYGAERINGHVGVWMEFLHGNTLEDELVKEGPFGAARVVRIGVELADALATVHHAGLIHRDVKTKNVMRDGADRLVLTDFGSCEFLGAEAERSERTIGTPLCAAPEVLAGQPATKQTDVYSLGVLLYRLITGGYPVEGRTLEAVRDAHARGVRTTLRATRPDLPHAIAEAIDCALDPDPAERYQTAEAFGAALSSISESSGAASVESLANAKPRRRWVVAFAALLVLVAAGATLSRWWKPVTPAIAVLPLKNLGADPSDSDFADGLTDELTRQLTMIRGLDVRSRTSSFVFKDRAVNLREIGRQLRSDYLLTGSVLHVGDRVRINAQLVRVSDDATVWAAKFDRSSNDLLKIQDEISRSIISQLQVKLDRLPRRYDIDAATYERYLRARALSERKDRSSLLTAITYYKEVIASDTSFAPAYAGLADAYADYEFWGVNYEAAYSQVKNAASKALELDPSLPEAHAAMGLVYARDRHWQEAEREFQRSIQINPNLSRTHRAYGFWTLYQEGKLAEALKELQLALRNDPLSLDVRRMMAYIEVSAGQYAAAIDDCRHVLKEDPKFPLIPFVLGRALLFNGNTAEAISVLEAIPPNRAPELGYAYATIGRRGDAEALAQKAKDVPLTQAVIYAGLNDADRAFAALERAAAIGDPKIGAALTYPELAVLRVDPRFGPFRQRLGLP
jgi:eukaryotic-like serine/threonine-protein kinase